MLHNAEIEKSVLGCLILDNGLIPNCKAEVKDMYFNNSVYRRLFEEIVECYEKKGIADITVLKSIDIEMVAEIINFVPTTANFATYKQELIDLGVKRDMVKATDTIRAKIMNSDATPDILKIESLNLFNGVKVQSSYKEPTGIADIMANSITKLENRFNGIHEKRKKWGIKWLDEKTGGIKSEFTILAARPSIGKTALALQIGKFVSKQGSKVAIFSLEMDAESVTNRMICNMGNVNKNYFDKDLPIPLDVWETICRTAGEVGSLPIDIYDKCFTIEEIILNCEEQRTKKGLDFIVIDYLQLCETTHKTNSTNDRVSHISRQIKKYQQQTGIPILALSQFNRETEQKKYPTLANLRDSGSLEQDANNVFFLHEESKDPDGSGQRVHQDLILIIAKQREGERDIYGNLKFYGATQRFYDN